MPKTPIGLALAHMPPGTKLVKLSPEDRMRPIIVDAATHRFLEMLRAAAVGSIHRPVIFFWDDADVPPPPAPNPETIAILREMFPDEPRR